MSNKKVELLEKIRELGFNPTSISKYTAIPDGRIYKWYAGKGSPKIEDLKKLEDLYEKFQKNPTNDFAAAAEATENSDKLHKLEKKIEELEKFIERISTSNADLTGLLKNAIEFSSKAVHPSLVLQPYLEKISLAGVGVCWVTFEEGLIALGKIVLSDSVEKIKLDKRIA